MVKRLIINADDFGMTEGVTNGIIDCHRDGVLTSTTLLVNAPFTEYALEEAKKYPDLGVGIHLATTYGRPLVAGEKSFTDAHGNFKLVTSYPNRWVDVDPDELYEEWHAQFERFIELAGKLPTHIDSHHHVHLNPNHHKVVLKLAKLYDVPVRQMHTHDGKLVETGYEPMYFKGDFYGEDLTVAHITDALHLDVPVMEIMTHPAYLDELTYELSSYRVPRMREMTILRSPELKDFIKNNDIELIDFSGLMKKE